MERTRARHHPKQPGGGAETGGSDSKAASIRAWAVDCTPAELPGDPFLLVEESNGEQEAML